MTALQVATFNCEWRKSSSTDAAIIRDLVLGGGTHVVCLTEAYRDFFGGEGHTIEAEADGRPDGRRKVLLWSREPWTGVDAHGPDSMPSGRFVSGRTETPLGPITFFGLCIPYRWAGMKEEPKRSPWEFHLAYLAAFDRHLPAKPWRTVAFGDFNQRVPRKYQPPRIYSALDAVLLSRLEIATGGVIEPLDRQSIDHICHSPDLTANSCFGLSNVGPDGTQISDHFGVKVSLGLLDVAAPTRN